MAATDQDHWVDPYVRESSGSRAFGHLLLVAVAVIVVAFGVWAHYATLDIVTRGEARVIPSSQVQVIQNLEGGILSEILVTEGQIVEAGDVLLRIENTAAEANFRDLRQRYLRGLAIAARLEAEIAGKTDAEDIVFEDEVLAEALEVAKAEKQLFRARQSQLVSQIAILQEQEKQRRQEVSELKTKLNRLSRSHALANEELDITRPLAQQGVIARTELLRREREVNDLAAEIDAATLAQPRAESALQEALRRMEERVLTFRTESSQLLSEARQELASIVEALTTDEDRVVRTEVRSLVHGAVKEIKVRTVGGVIQPGQDLMEIVPIEDTLLVEAQVLPKDIAFLHPNQPAMVKITAYDFGIYGGLDAVVEHISADAIEDKEAKRSYFRIYLRTEKNFLGTPEAALPIIPGMTATVDILTGQKTVLEYILKPILSARDNALRER